jgi:hypothetical protein
VKPKLLAAAFALIATFSIGAQDAKQELQQKLAAVKESVAQNQAALRKYQWTEHTEIMLKGEVKSTKDEACRYGPDGKVQKTELGPPPQQKELRGVKKRLVEKKKEDLTDYMQRAVTLIHDYVPPNPENIQAAFQAGNASLGQAGPGTVQLQITNYWQQGDALTFTFNSAAKALTQVNINSYLGDAKDAITLQVDFQTLPDGTNYAATTNLNAPAKNLSVRTQNSNYQRIQ